MAFGDPFRRQFSKMRHAQIARGNTRADRQVVAELGLSEHFTEEYETTGTSSGDIAFLHAYIRDHMPKRVIEFGSGKSTWVIAKCMERYCWDHHGGNISLVSMEESSHWYEQQLKFFPKQSFNHWDKFVRIVRSDTEIHRFRFAAGMSYVDTPMEHFDFCFVDGPDAHGTCNMDFIKLVAMTDRPMTALIDTRKSTQMAYAALLGKQKLIRYHTGLCLVDEVTRADLIETKYKDIFPENQKILRF